MSMFEETREVCGVTISVPIGVPPLVPPYRIDPHAIDVATPRRANPARILTAYTAGRDLARRGVVLVTPAEHPRGGFWCTIAPKLGGDALHRVHSDHMQARMFHVLSVLATDPRPDRLRDAA